MPFAALMVSGTARGGKGRLQKKQQCRKAIDVATAQAKSFQISLLWPRIPRVNAGDRKTGWFTKRGLLIRANLTYFVRGNPQQK